MRRYDTIGSVLCDETGKALSVYPTSLGAYELTVDTSPAGNDLSALIDAAGGTSTTLASAISDGLTAILVTVATNPVRTRFDGGDPSAAGTTWGTNNTGTPYVWETSDFTDVKLIGVGGSATVNIELFS